MAKKTPTQTAKSTNGAGKLSKPPTKKCIKQQEKVQKEENQIAKILKSLK